jgi:uncharacterized membrane protein
MRINTRLENFFYALMTVLIQGLRDAGEFSLGLGANKSAVLARNAGLNLVVWHMLISVLFVVLIAVGVIVLSHILSSEDGRRPSDSRTIDLLSHRAIELLDERYVNGQIDHEEYLQRRLDILGR